MEIYHLRTEERLNKTRSLPNGGTCKTHAAPLTFDPKPLEAAFWADFFELP